MIVKSKLSVLKISIPCKNIITEAQQMLNANRQEKIYAYLKSKTIQVITV